MFALYIVTSTPLNHPPLLLSKLLSTDRNTDISTQLEYYDRENDKVEFSLLQEPEHGLANMSLDGWLVYDPDEFFIGWDEFTVILEEIDLPVGIEGKKVQQVIRVQVRETPVAPALFLELEEGLSKDGSDWRLFTG